MRKSVLLIPPIRRLYDGYFELSNETDRLAKLNGELQGENTRLKRESASVKAAALINSAIEQEKRALQKVSAGLQATASALERENQQMRAEIEKLKENANLAHALDNLTASMGSNFLQLAKTVQSHLLGLQSIQESNNLIFRNDLNRHREEVTKLLGGERDDHTVNGAQAWLDLLESVLTGTLLEDSAISSWSKDQFDPTSRLLGRDWPKNAMTMIGTARMRNLRALCERAIVERIPGDFIETGVWRGGACIYMKAIADAFGETDRRVFLADSFRGLPEPDPVNYPQDKDDEHHEFEQLVVSRQQVEDNFRRFHLLDNRVVFLEGWFRDTLPTAPVESIALLRLDGDMYESTIVSLESLYSKVSPGGFVIIDDYVLDACRSAVDSFRRERGIAAELHEVDGSAVWWQVPG